MAATRATFRKIVRVLTSVTIHARPAQNRALRKRRTMPLSVAQGVPTLFLRRAAYERAGLTRVSLDTRLGLTDAEFRVEGDIVALGPVYDVDALGKLVDDLEALGLTYFED